MLKKINCKDTGMVTGSSNCNYDFKVFNGEHLRLEANKHYLYDEPHTGEYSNNFLFKSENQFETEKDMWEKIFNNDRIAEEIKRIKS